MCGSFLLPLVSARAPNSSNVLWLLSRTACLEQSKWQRLCRWTCHNSVLLMSTCSCRPSALTYHFLGKLAQVTIPDQDNSSAFVSIWWAIEWFWQHGKGKAACYQQTAALRSKAAIINNDEALRFSRMAECKTAAWSTCIARRYHTQI